MSIREQIHKMVDEAPDNQLMRILFFMQSLSENENTDYIETALDEAEYEAEHTAVRLTDAEVFSRIRRKLNA